MQTIEPNAAFMSAICADMEAAGQTALSHEMTIAASELAGEMATNPEIAGVLDAYAAARQGKATFSGSTCSFTRDSSEVQGLAEIEHGTDPVVDGTVQHLDGSETTSRVPKALQRGQHVPWLAISPTIIEDNLAKQDQTLVGDAARESAANNKDALVPEIKEMITGMLQGALGR